MVLTVNGITSYFSYMGSNHIYYMIHSSDGLAISSKLLFDFFSGDIYAGWCINSTPTPTAAHHSFKVGCGDGERMDVDGYGANGKGKIKGLFG
ncbi:hypothetical protein U1Q18_019975 [Sarracenia purpurea var. burkii]